MLVLYRKYRPKNFSQVISQEHVVKILKNALVYNKISHAYLFCGSRGIGKTTIARILAKAANCQNLSKSGEPCNECFSCNEINEGKSIDLLEIDAASNRGINEIRDLREKIKFAPTSSKYKVFIIDEVHMLTLEAFNALLKTLEEPPAHCIFILATTAAHKVPATILSRCQRFDFRKLSRAEIEEHLEEIAKSEKIKIEKPVLSLIAREAQGSSRDALTIFGQIMTLEDKEITFKETKEILGISDFTKITELVDFISKRDVKGSLNLINELADSGEDLNQFLKELLEYLRKLMLLKVDLDFNKLPELNFTFDELAKAKTQIGKIKENDLTNLISQIIKAKKEVEISSLPQLPLELAILESLKEEQKESENFQPNGGGRNLKLQTSDILCDNAQRQNLKSASKTSNLNSNSYQDAGQSFVSDALVDALTPALDKSKNNSVTLFDIQKNWPKVQELAKQKNFSLFVFLRSSFPLDFKKGCLTLACRYNLHKERLEDVKTRMSLEEILSKVMGEKILIKCCLEGRLSAPANQKDFTSDIDNKKTIPLMA
jgi:DNA polymerase-3 subunit gamma/tau